MNRARHMAGVSDEIVDVPGYAESVPPSPNQPGQTALLQSNDDARGTSESISPP